MTYNVITLKISAMAKTQTKVTKDFWMSSKIY